MILHFAAIKLSKWYAAEIDKCHRKLLMSLEVRPTLRDFLDRFSYKRSHFTHTDAGSRKLTLLVYTFLRDFYIIIDEKSAALLINPETGSNDSIGYQMFFRSSVISTQRLLIFFCFHMRLRHISISALGYALPLQNLWKRILNSTLVIGRKRKAKKLEQISEDERPLEQNTLRAVARYCTAPCWLWSELMSFICMTYGN